MLTKTQRKNNLKLIEALRSGKYQQICNKLRNDNDEFCCLGVACDVVLPKLWGTPDAAGYTEHDGGGCSPSDKVINKYGWNHETLKDTNDYIDAIMMDMNDNLGKSFPEIADVLEAWLDKQEIKK